MDLLRARAEMEPRDTSLNARPSGEEHQKGSLMSRSVPGRSRAVPFAAALRSWRSAAPLSNRRFSLERKTLILHFKEEELGSFGPTKRTTVLTSETRILWSFRGGEGGTERARLSTLTCQRSTRTPPPGRQHLNPGSTRTHRHHLQLPGPAPGAPEAPAGGATCSSRAGPAASTLQNKRGGKEKLLL